MKITLEAHSLFYINRVIPSPERIFKTHLTTLKILSPFKEIKDTVSIVVVFF